jgi:hypothetical protein
VKLVKRAFMGTIQGLSWWDCEVDLGGCIAGEEELEAFVSAAAFATNPDAFALRQVGFVDKSLIAQRDGGRVWVQGVEMKRERAA